VPLLQSHALQEGSTSGSVRMHADDPSLVQHTKQQARIHADNGNEDAEREPSLEGDRLRFNLPFYCTPETANSSQLIFRSELYQPREKVSKMLMFIVNATPKWLGHIAGPAKILDGDMKFLNRQSTQILNGELTPGFDYFMPAACDKGTHQLWSFMRKYSPGGINYYPHVAEAKPKTSEECLDRLSQHTLHCKYCMGAYENTKRGMVAAVATGIVAALAACTTFAAGFEWKVVGSCTLVAALALWVWHKLRDLKKEFTYRPYIHAEKH
jgi:hypothetical protein